MKQFTPDGRTRRYTRNLFCAEARWPMYRTYHPIGRRMVSRKKQFDLFCRQLENFADKIREWHDRLKENAK